MASTPYHRRAIWGIDILKVGESLGIGSVGMWLHSKAHRVSTTDRVLCELVLDGPVPYSHWVLRMAS